MVAGGHGHEDVWRAPEHQHKGVVSQLEALLQGAKVILALQPSKMAVGIR